jgi:hypothetical protein
MRLARTCLFATMVLASTGCARYSYRIRAAYSRGDYGSAVARCQGDALAAATRWNDGHRARYHVYCGMTFLAMGDSARAASELVQAERLRMSNPRLITGRDLDQLSAGLTQLFGVPAGQLQIDEQVASVEAAAPSTARPAAPSVSAKVAQPPVIVVPEAPAVPGAPETPEPPVAPAPSEEPMVTVSATPAPPAAAPAPSPPVIVIPEEDGADIE